MRGSMDEGDGETIENYDSASLSRRWRKRWIALWAILALLVVALVASWFSRERIAGNIIESQLDAMGLDATYDIERIGGTRQTIANLVVGDPQRPDFTADKISVILRYRLGLPTVGRVELVNPRLFGTYRDGELSFGSLDSVLFDDSAEASGLPDLDLKIVDGRALLDTDFGPVGLKLEGEGELDSGFSGVLAASAPSLSFDGCAAESTTLFGKLTTRAGRATVDGPLRAATLECPDRSLSLRSAAIEGKTTLSKDFSGFESNLSLTSGTLMAPWARANGMNGTVEASYRAERLNARYSVALRGLEAEQVRAALATADGTLRTTGGFARMDLQADVEGNGLKLGNGLDRTLADFQQSASGTLAAPLLEKIRGALARESRGSSFAAHLTARQGDGGTVLVVPEGRLRGGSGATLLSISQLQLGGGADREGAPRFSGNFSTGGEGLPRIVGRMEQRGDGEPMLRLRMAEYSAGGASLAVPELVVAQSAKGQIGFAGSIEASGDLPGGAAEGLILPVNGAWSPGSGLAMWRRCTDIAFERLQFANLALINRKLTVCPGSGGSILRSDANGVRIVAGAPELDLAGSFGETPIAIRSGPIGFAWPGALSARALDITLGPAGTDTSFRISNLDAQLGGEEVAGTFDEADVRLYSIPLDILNAAGEWRYAGDRLEISGGTFRLADRENPARFEPLAGRDGRLTLADNVITATAGLHERSSERIVTSVDIRHDLESGTGHADIDVPGLVFDDRLQPDVLTPLALGVIANAEGTITGTGRIDWNENDVASSGEFSTEGLDFAAAFGPVKGASGTIVFTDLINLTTAPGQTLKVASINPGIEIFDGEVAFSLNNGTALSVAGGTWPFLGGTLTLQPVDLTFGASEVRRYVLVIEGLDAGQFVQQMELGNISATGKFDGTVPLVFDEAGNGSIETGLLVSRPPGGNVSYVGELTYEDLSAMANFAFDTLRSLDYREMTVRMDGSLTGEIVTRVRFDGVKQGEGTKSNIITKQIAKLPVRFNVNVRAPFYQLITSFKAMYDPAFVRDPRELGLLSDDGTRFLRPSVTAEEVEQEITPEDLVPDEPPIQSPESENVR